MSEDKTNTTEYCAICRRSDKYAGPMMHLPGNMTVCHDCLQRSLDQAMQFSGGDLSNLMGNMDLSQMFGGNNPFGFQFDPNTANNGNTSINEADSSDDQDDENALTEAAGSEVPDDPDQEDSPDTPDEPEKKKNNRMNRPPMGFSMVMTPEEFQNFFTGGPRAQRAKKNEDGPKKPPVDLSKIPAPHKIYEMLSEYVIGQDHAKKAISVAVYNHYKRIANEDKNVDIEKSNMLMIGPTGSGKTFLVKTLANLLDVPLAIADATSLTEAGYIGDDIESVVSKLLAAADNDVEKAETGIIFIDEIDKLARKRNATQRDVSGESVQQGLLKLLEGAEIEVPVGANSKNAMVPLETVNTKNILFICGGAFPDLEEIIKERLNEKSSMGFGADLKDKYDHTDVLSFVETEDIRRFGMIPEFIGRLPVIFTLQGMDKDMLVRVLKEPKNAILKQYQKLLEMDEVELLFADDAYEAIAEKALKKDTGARALRSIIESFMLDIMFEIPKDENIGRVTITADYINGTGGPLIEMRTDSPRLLTEKG